MAEQPLIFTPRWLYEPPDGKNGVITDSFLHESDLRKRGWKENPGEFGTITHPERPASPINMAGAMPLGMDAARGVTVEWVLRTQGLVDGMQQQLQQGHAERMALQGALALLEQRMSDQTTHIDASLLAVDARHPDLGAEVLKDFQRRLSTVERQVTELVTALGGDHGKDTPATEVGRTRRPG